MSMLHQFVLDCGSTFTDELYKLTRFSFSPFKGEWEKRNKIAETRIKTDCTRLAPSAPPAAAAPAVIAPVTGATTPAAAPP